MRIILSNKFYYPRGGDCIHVIDLKNLLEEHGHQVAVFSMKFPENLENEYSALWPSEVSFGGKAPQNLLLSLRRPFGVNEVKTKWNQLLNDFKPDIVHVHNIHSQLSPIIAKIAKERCIPVVWTLHDYKLICPAYTLMDNDGKVCEDCFTDAKSVIKKKCIKGSILGSTLGYLEGVVWSKEKLENYTGKFIAPSKFLKNKMIQGGFREDQITHIYNFADNNKFEHIVKTERKNQVVYVGRLSREKGVETLCKSFQIKKDIKLKIIGDGPLRSTLEKKYASTKISFLGFQSWGFIKEELANAKFLIIPSEWYENNPLTIIESLALGTPVLGARIGGIPELISENINGLTFISGNMNDLSTRINEMLAINYWDYKTIQKDAKQLFSQEIYYQNLLKIYLSLSKSNLYN